MNLRSRFCDKMRVRLKKDYPRIWPTLVDGEITLERASLSGYHGSRPDPARSATPRDRHHGELQPALHRLPVRPRVHAGQSATHPAHSWHTALGTPLACNHLQRPV
jgi:hypothetical protein